MPEPLPDMTTRGPGESVLILAEPGLADSLQRHLLGAGYQVATAATGPQALKIAARQSQDLVLIDQASADLSLTALLPTLRIRNHKSLAIIVLHDEPSPSDRLSGLGLGVDRWLPRSRPVAVVARAVNELLRRLSKPSLSVLTHGPLRVDRAARLVHLEAEVLALTATEFLLLNTLMEKPGKVLDRELLYSIIWDTPSTGGLRAVDVQISRLRSKLGTAGDLIETVRGRGYRFWEPA